MASCRFYINQLTKDEKIQDILTSYHNQLFKQLIDSKLFNKYNEHYFLAPVGDGRYTKAQALIQSINQQYSTPVVGTAYTKTNQKEFVFVNVKNLLQKAKDQAEGQGTFFQKNPNAVNATLKIIDALNKSPRTTYPSSQVNGFYNDLRKYGANEQQISLLREYIQRNNIKEINKNDLIAGFMAEMSYTVEINTATAKEDTIEPGYGVELEGHPTQYYVGMTVPGGTNYTENEIRTPDITPSIKGHAQFSTDQGIGWFRSDDKRTKANNFEEYFSNLKKDYPKASESTAKLSYEKVNDQRGIEKTRRILEIQSDLFQKGRNQENLASGDIDKEIREQYGEDYVPQIKPEYRADRDSKYFAKNQFLQLLNKDNNWVAFFVKSIIQDSAKKGYEKVLFPTGNTAAKVEGHQTLEEFIKNRQAVLDNTKKLRDKQIELLKDPKEIDKARTDLFYSDSVSDEQIVNDLIGSKDREIAQFEKEIKDAKGGSFKISSIAKFYETTIKNILDKRGYKPERIKDEYGNEWYQISLNPERDLATFYFQKPGIQQSKASPATIAKLKEFLERIGVKIQSLDLQRYGGINGVANILQRIIEVADGKENIALPEEAMHFVTDILKSTNAPLYRKMFNQIHRYNAFTQVKNLYSNDEDYKNPDGTLNIPKIKEEAMGKVLAEYYIRQEEGSTEKPDLMVYTKSWWQELLDWVRHLLNIAKINPFEEAAQAVDTITNNITPDELKGFAEFVGENSRGITAEGIRHLLSVGNYKEITDNVYEQLSDEDTYWNTVDKMFGGDVRMADELIALYKGNTFFQKSEDNNDLFSKFDEQKDKYQLTKHEDRSDPDDENVRSYYTVVVDGKTLKTDRVTDWAERTNLHNTGGKNYAANAPEEKQKYWAKQAMEGLKGHYDLENMIDSGLNEDGTIKPKDQIQLNVSPATNPGVYEQLRKFLFGTPSTEGFLYRFPEGTKFRTEQQVYDPNATNKYGEGRAGTMDLVVILPNGDVEVYDWKFMGFSLSRNIDQPFQKRGQHALQLAGYRNILKQEYGVKNVKAFTIPIHAQYQDSTISGTNEKVPILTNVTIGKANFKDEERTYLLPVVPEDQSTGSEEIDTLVKRLKSHYEKLYKKSVSEEERVSKIQDLDQISAAIRNLQVRLNFEPLVRESVTFQDLVKKTLEKYKDNNSPTILKELSGLYNSAATYESMDDAFVSEYGYTGLEEKQKATLDALQIASKDAREARKDILAKMSSVVEGMSEEQIKASVLSPEIEIKGILDSVTEASFLPNNSIKLFTKLLNTARSNQKKASDTKIRKMLDLYYKAGANVFERITKKGKMELVDRMGDRFKADLNKAKREKDRKFILDNIDKERFDMLAKEYVEAQTKIVNDREAINGYSSDSTANRLQAKDKREGIKRGVYINQVDFDGWNDKIFNRLVWNSLKEDPSQFSEEYRNIAKDTSLLEFYNFMWELNRHAYRVGYLNDKQSMRFIPLITGTALERLAQAKDKFAAIRHTMSDTFMVQIEELQAYGKLDPETGKPSKSIPRHYTRTDKEYDELSKDLPRILSHYIEAVDEYTTNQALEDVAVSLLSVEESKGHLEVDKHTGKVVFSGNTPQTFAGNRVNAEMLQKIIDDAIYGIQEDSNTLIDSLVGKVKKGTEEEKEKTKLAIKKGIQESNAYVQSLAVGLKPLVAIPNFVGANLQAAINAGHFYLGREYFKNEVKLVASATLSDVEKALIDYFVPLNEEVSKSTRRGVLWKQSKRDWLRTWSFRDFMMSSNRLPDVLHELANVKTWIDNTIVVDGKFENIRQYLRNGEFLGKYKEAESGGRSVKQSEKDMERRVEELKAKSLSKIAKFDSGGYLTIPGIDPSTSNYGEYRTKIVEYGRNITSQMSRDNKADYRRNILARSFAMFKNWIIRQAELRAMDIHKNDLIDEWEYGRMRLYIKIATHLGFKSLLKIRDIKNATPEGLRIMREIMEQKKIDYYKKFGQELKITEEEFFDMVRKELTSETKELRLLMGLLAMVLWSYSAAPPDDDDALTKNRYKTMAKAISKIADELRFYYNPLSFQSMTNGTLLPSLGVLIKAEQLLQNTASLSWGAATDNEALMDKSHPLKYFLNMIPGPAQFQNEVLPIFDPEMAKELGIRVTSSARAFR